MPSPPSDSPIDAQNRRWWRFALAQALVWGGIASTAALISGQRKTAGIEVNWFIIANFFTAAALTSGIAVVLHACRWRAQSGPVVAALLCGLPVVAAAVHVAVAMGSGTVLGDAWSFTGFAYPRGVGVVRPAALYLLWTLGYVVVEFMLARYDGRRRLEQLEQLVRDGEVELLKAQFDPHFLFNTLTLLQAESDDPARVEEVTQRLAQYLRTATHSGRELVRVGQQVDECQAYLNLQRARFGPRLSWRIDVADAVFAAVLPSLTVQTLVEYAVRHGMEQTGEPAEIAILAHEVPAGVRLEVCFPGFTTAVEGTVGGVATCRPASRHGLRDLRRRLELLCGPTARLDHSATAGVVTLAIEAAKTPPRTPPTPWAPPA